MKGVRVAEARYALSVPVDMGKDVRTRTNDSIRRMQREWPMGSSVHWLPWRIRMQWKQTTAWGAEAPGDNEQKMRRNRETTLRRRHGGKVRMHPLHRVWCKSVREEVYTRRVQSFMDK